ncbi:MAG: hypothetical protein A2283_15255 [Lentisphaerae bacterium RIFOXYA12_FULL_48_11]|nr:MAG: hypothetical protein A2283_15255 [Lentisphaerae bacterium RIFOXYA12_FULL_48_11]
MSPEELKGWLRHDGNVAGLLPSNVIIEGHLNSGGQGIVFRGKVNGEPAAIKVYFPGVVEKRIEREVKALRTLRCRTIVSLLWSDYITVDGTSLPVVATSLLEGQSLDQTLMNRPLTLNEISVLAFDCTLAIEEMWKTRIVHRDLKPSNIIIHLNGRASVIDLGIARHIDQSCLTSLGTTWGTRGYMSPEQMKCIQQLTCKSDLFALGIVLIEASLQRHPSGRDQAKLVDLQLHDRLPSPISGWEHVDLLRALLDPHPTKRPPPPVILQLLINHALKE